MLFEQFVDEDLGCGSYLVGDADAGEAVVVDPSFRIERYVEAAERLGVKIVRVLETHTHADHLSGHGRFALEHGVPTSISRLAGAEYPHDPLDDGDVITVGSVSIRVVTTPGHRPEHCAYVINEQKVLTGDSLFVGSAARPDLAVEAVEGARDLYASLKKLAALPDEIEVFPGHVAGSLCGTHMSPERSTTIGHERESNTALAIDDLETFVHQSADVKVPRPPTTALVVSLNRGPWVAKPAPTPPFEAPGDALMIDVRPLTEYARGFVKGAISIPLDAGSFGTRAAFLIGENERVVIVAMTPEQVHEASWRLWAVGKLDIAGYLSHAEVTEQLPLVNVQNFEDLYVLDVVQVVDVREPGERERVLLNSVAIPLREIRGDHPELDKSRPIVTICESGVRSAIAASVLLREGYIARAVVGGGVNDLDPVFAVSAAIANG